MALAKDSSLSRLVPIAERAVIEGEPFGQTLSLENGTVADAQVFGAFQFPSLSRAFYIENIALSSNKALAIQILLGSNPTQSTIQQVYRLVLNPGVPAMIPVRQAIRPHLAGDPSGSSTSVGDFRIRKMLDATPTGAYVYASPTGYSLYDDFNFSADKVGLIIGDSIVNGTAGITSKNQSMEWKMRNWFIDHGQNVRLINKAVSGSTTTQHELRRQLGVYDFPQVDYIHYQLGTNDSGAVNGAGTNLAAMIAWKQKRYPKALMIVWGATPRESDSVEAALDTVRAAQQAAVVAANDPKVLYHSLAASFDRKVTSNYATTDAAGDRVHPSAAGHAAAYAEIANYLSAQNVAL